MLSGCVAWPRDLEELYRGRGYWRGESLGRLLRDVSATSPERCAVVDVLGRCSYGELDARVDGLAAALHDELGIRPCDRVVVQLPNTRDFVALCIALFRLGALPVLALPAHRKAEIGYLCRHTDAVAYVIPDVQQGFDYRDLAAQLRRECPTVAHVLVAGDPGAFTSLSDLDAAPRELPEPAPDDVAFFLLSGGTTSVPKLIPRTHDDYAFQLRATAAAMGLDETGGYLAALPVAHNAALGCPGVLGALRAGAKAVLAASPSPDEVFPLVAREGVTLTTLMPSVLQLWVESARYFEVDLSGLVIEVGGAMLDPTLARRVNPELGARLSHWFGMAEGLLCFTRLEDPEDVVAETQGHPLCEADDLRVVDEEGAEVPPGAVGELLARGPYTLRGYYRADDANREAFTDDGFLRTGDLVRIRPDGRLVVVGRRKDVINRGGEKVAAPEVEDGLRTHPAVHAVAVVAVPDPALGEKTCAVVVPRGEPPTLPALREHLLVRGFAPYKLPDRLELRDAMPMTGVGKVDKRALHGQLSAADPRAGVAPVVPIDRAV